MRSAHSGAIPYYYYYIRGQNYYPCLHFKRNACSGSLYLSTKIIDMRNSFHRGTICFAQRISTNTNPRNWIMHHHPEKLSSSPIGFQFRTCAVPAVGVEDRLA
eukprot:scaffold2720_cov173-Amphora_coffeaeformis.AAC.19